MDIFAEEQKKFEVAVERVRELREGKTIEAWEFEMLVAEYGKLLKELRRLTHITDKNGADDSAGLHDKVNRDLLTGLYNIRYMEEELEKNIKELSCGNDAITVMIADIDFFKQYNDAYGYHAGDECLKEIAAALLECVPREDGFIARYGGEEFAVVLPRFDEERGRKVADKLLESVRKRYIVHEKNDAAPCVTVSIGVTTVKPQQTDTIRNYIKRTQQALYASKQNGRNRYIFLMFREDV